MLSRVLLVCSLVCLVGCGDDDAPGGTGGHGGGGTGGQGGGGGTGGTGPRTDCVDIEHPTGAATFDAVYDEVFCTNTCTDSFCHGATGAGELRLDRREAAYTALINVLADGEECRDSGLRRVVPFDAEASLLIQKLHPEPVCGTAMPQGVELTDEGYVVDAQIAQIAAWINAGALRHPPAVEDAGDLDASPLDGATDDAGE